MIHIMILASMFAGHIVMTHQCSISPQSNVPAAILTSIKTFPLNNVLHAHRIVHHAS